MKCGKKVCMEWDKDLTVVMKRLGMETRIVVLIQ